MSAWDDPQTAAYYEAFCRTHSRYSRANAALIAHARIEPGQRVLDLAAGTGRTAEAVLERVGERGRIIAVEPSDAMRAEGIRRVANPRVEWRDSLPAADTFDRIVCGAAIWQFHPLADTLGVLSALLRPGGALCFNNPSLYLLEPDDPGGGADPLLLSLPALLWRRLQPAAPAFVPALDRPSLTAWLRASGLRSHPWRFRIRLSQDAYAAWLKIPILTDGMMPGVPTAERARRIDAALEAVDRSSWKWERWSGWTAWKI